MAFDIFVSPGVFTRETDLTFAKAGAAPLVGTLMGLTQKGKAFVPIKTTGFSDFIDKFGDLNPNYYTPYAAKNYLENSDSVYTIRILGQSDVTLAGPIAHIAFPRTSITSAQATASGAGSNLITVGILRGRTATPGELSYTGNYDSCTLSAAGYGTITVSFDKTKENYIKKVLGTNPSKVYTGDSLSSWYVDAVFDYANVNYTLSSVTGLLSSSSGVNAYGIMNSISGGYSNASTPIIVSQNFGGSVYNLFRIHNLGDGSNSNYDVKISITNVETLSSTGGVIDYPKFDLIVRAFGDSDRRPAVYEYYSGINLNPNDKNFIARAIGDKYLRADVTQTIPEIVEEGQFDNISKFIRVEVYEGAPKTGRPSGFKGVSKGAAFKTVAELPYKTNYLDHNNEVSTAIYMGADFTKDGVIDRLKPTVTDVDPSGIATLSNDGGFIILGTASETSLTSNISSTFSSIINLTLASASSFAASGTIRFSVPMFGGWDGFTPETSDGDLQANGSLTSAYLNAAKIISNTRAFDTNLVVTPGINSSTPGNIVEKILDKVESRKDSFYIFDLGTQASTTSSTGAMDISLESAVNETDRFDSSYAAAYYPWLKIYDPTNDKYVWVPPSTLVFGAYAYNDKVSQLWSSPAGFNRAALNSAKGIRKRITEPQSDILYNARINPIVSFATEGIVIYGQKTLQKKASALDRVNVRRLLLEVRKRIASFAKMSLFEPNDPTTRSALENVIKTYMRRVQELRGVYDFQVQLDDTTTTPDLVDRNIIAGKIFLKPTRTAEFISLEFILMPTGATFSE